jgi:hypothetical protein
MLLLVLLLVRIVGRRLVCALFKSQLLLDVGCAKATKMYSPVPEEDMGYVPHHIDREAVAHSPGLVVGSSDYSLGLVVLVHVAPHRSHNSAGHGRRRRNSRDSTY